MNARTFCCVTACWMANAISSAAAVDAPLAPDEHTLLLAHFDGNADADHAVGQALAEGSRTLTQQGRFGGGLALGGRHALTFSGKGNFPGNEGTIEFWIQPRWNGDDGRVRSVLTADGAARDQISINKLPTGQFGVGVFGTPNGATEAVYCRVNHDIRAWRAGQWHHVAVCWGAGELVLWLDGQKVAARKGAVAPQTPPADIRLTGDDVVLDELCISRVVRYTEQGRLAGSPVAPRRKLGYDWKFNEPPGVYRCARPEGAAVEAGLAVVPKHYLDETDPQRLPQVAAPRVDLFAAPGEQEPATLLLVAAEPLKGVTVQVSDLQGERQSLASRQVAVRRVVRTPMRSIYTAKADETEVVNRFLPRWQPLDIAAGELREVWLQFNVPADLAGGAYTGTVTISHAGGTRSLPVRLEVLPIRLIDHPRKALASYYNMSRRMSDKDRLLRELRDMRAHGIRHLHLHSGIRINYAKKGDTISPDFGDILEGLDLLRQCGFADGTMVIDTGLTTLARMLGHNDLGEHQSGQSLDGDEAFHKIAKQAMEQVVQLQRRTPDFRLMVTHLDEVFAPREWFDQYLRLSKAVRQVPEAKLYITFHTLAESHEALRRELDPFVDLRCNHGYSFELWLARGHTMDEYDAELKAGGDEAWFYHNARGAYWTPEWSRIVNGLYLWASPFSAHCPWSYQGYYDNPFDDTDGPATRGHDWGLSFPGIDDPADLVPTRCYEAMREGGDDLRYIATLEKAILDAPAPKRGQASAAQALLGRWRDLVRKARPALQESSPAPKAKISPAVDADTGLIMGKGVIGTPSESPLVNALAERFSSEQWQQLRREIAEWVVTLQR